MSAITDALTSAVGDSGVYAVFGLMMLDAVFPAGSEIVMLYGGALAAGAFPGSEVQLFGWDVGTGVTAYVVIALAGTLGYLVGSLIGWLIGFYGGRPLLERHGRWFHVTPAKLDRAERWFQRYEVWTSLRRSAGPPRALVRLDPGGLGGGSTGSLHAPHAGRFGNLVLCIRRRRIRTGDGLGALPRALPVARLRHPRDRRPGDRSRHRARLAPSRTRPGARRRI